MFADNPSFGTGAGGGGYSGGGAGAEDRPGGGGGSYIHGSGTTVSTGVGRYGHGYVHIEYIGPPSSSSPLPPEALSSAVPESEMDLAGDDYGSVIGHGDHEHDGGSPLPPEAFSSTVSEDDGSVIGDGDHERDGVEGGVASGAARVMELLFPAYVWLGDGSLPGTGPTIGYEDAFVLPRPVPGEPYFGQEAQDGLRLLPEERFVRYEASHGEAVVLDQETKLEWQGCVAGYGGPGCEVGWEVMMSAEEAEEYCELSTWGGYDDWRLPGREELRSLVEHGGGSPTIDLLALPGTPAGLFWTSTGYGEAAGFTWSVDFEDGSVVPIEKEDAAHVRCVRAGLGP